MFSLFTKRTVQPTLKSDPIGFFLDNSEQRKASSLKYMPKHIADQNYQYVARNANNGLQDVLIKHALQLRSKKDLIQANTELNAATEFLDLLEDAIAKADTKGLILPPDKQGKHSSNYIEVYSLFYAFLVVFLMQDWSRAERLAKALKLPVLRESIEHDQDGDGGPYCHITKMFAALALDDQVEFKYQQKRYQEAKNEEYFWDKYFNYDQMMALILARDNAGFNAYLPKQEESYLKRKTDKKLKTWGMIFAPLEDNERIYDLWAAALCNVARYRGIDVIYSSEIIPNCS